MNTSWIDATTASVIQTVFGYPFELLKTRSQVSPSKYAMINDAITLYKHRGIAGFYNGAGLPFISTIFTYHSTFSLMNMIDSTLHIPNDPRNQIYSSGIAGMIIACLTNTIEVVKCNRQVSCHANPFKSSFLLRGITPHVIREGLGYTSYFGIYIYACRFLQDHYDLTTYSRFLSGAIAGVGSSMLVFPFDVWKTRSQVLSTHATPFFPPFIGVMLTITRAFIVNGMLFLFIGKDM